MSGARRRRVLLPGERLGYPLYTVLSGNLPVLSKLLHTPSGAAHVAPAEAAAAAARAAYAHISGNLSVLSTELRPPPPGLRRGRA